MFRAVGCDQIHFRRTGAPHELNYELMSQTWFALTRPAILLGEGRPDMRDRQKSSLSVILKIIQIYERYDGAN